MQESMAVAEMNPGGYDTAHLLQGAYAAFVPKGATSSDKSWLRIFTNLAVRFDSIACTKLKCETRAAAVLCFVLDPGSWLTD